MYVVRILSQPCNSSPCEKNWSAFEVAQTKKKIDCHKKMLDNLVYVLMNTIAKEKSFHLEVRDMEHINLDNLSEPLDSAANEFDENGYPLDWSFEYQEDTTNMIGEDLSWLDFKSV